MSSDAPDAGLVSLLALALSSNLSSAAGAVFVSAGGVDTWMGASVGVAASAAGVAACAAFKGLVVAASGAVAFGC